MTLRLRVQDHSAARWFNVLCAVGPTTVEADKRFIDDEWGTAIRYEHTTAVLDLRSAGPGRRFGTTDDITVRDGTSYASKRALYLERQDSARKDH